MSGILILGATSAIAENCARMWAEHGESMYLVARNKDQVEIIASDLKIRGAAKVETFVLNLNEFDKHQEMLDRANDSLGHIDTVLIAHGTLSNQKECEKRVALTIKEIETNALSTISLLTIIANDFEKKKSGTIVVLSSVAGDKGRSSNYVYGSAKAMVTTFTSGLRQRLYKSNVAVVTIKLGLVDTPMTSSFKKGILWVTPRKVARKIVRVTAYKNGEIYVPMFWKYIMLVIKGTPVAIFRRLKF